MRSLVILIPVFLALVSVPSFGGEVFFSEDFEKGLDENIWVEEGFPNIDKHNVFEWIAEPGGNHALKTVSDSSYSGKGIKKEFDPSRFKILSWRWKVSNVIEKADGDTKEGDDYAARIYIVFEKNFFSIWPTILVYCWDNKHPIESIYPNPWQKEKEKMIVLESGPAKVGSWVEERRNLYDDYVKAFQEKPPNVEGIAFVPDTDNTKSKVEAFFDDLKIEAP